MKVFLFLSFAWPLAAATASPRDGSGPLAAILSKSKQESEGVDFMQSLANPSKEDRSNHSSGGSTSQWTFQSDVDTANWKRPSFVQALTHRLLVSRFREDPQPKIDNQKRQLQAVDLPFDRFNEIFKGARVNLPDAETDAGIIELSISNLYCQDISLSDMRVLVEEQTSQQVRVSLQIQGLHMNCFTDYGYRTARVIRGNGRADVYMLNNQVSTSMTFSTSTSFNQHPPAAQATVSNCAPTLNIVDLDFNGGVVAGILDTFEKPFRNLVERQVENAICREMTRLGDIVTESVLQPAERGLENYLAALPTELADPLWAETQMLSASGDEIPELINFRDVANSLGSLVNDALQQADQMLAAPVDDLGGPTGTNQDLGVNVFLRNNLLDEDRCLSVAAADFPDDFFDPVLLDTDDFIIHTRIELEGVRLCGLDTFKQFDPLVDIGNHTLRNAFHWEELALDFDVLIQITPSSDPDSILQDVDQTVEIDEHARVSFGVESPAVTASILLAIKESLLDLPVGAMLQSTNLFPCFASVLHRFELTGFDVAVQNVREPVLSGFIDHGLDRVITDAVEAAFLMYEPTFLKALPNMFQRPFRRLVQQQFLEGPIFDPGQNECAVERLVDGGDGTSPGTTEPKYIDFRDLFYQPLIAEAMGGSGTKPYGDIGVLLYDVAKDQFVEEDGSGFPKFNEMVIRPATKAQSGIEGTLRFESELFSFSTEPSQSIAANERRTNNVFGSLVQKFAMSLSDLRLQNLDSVVSPLLLIEPTYQASVLNNLLTAGGGDDDMSVTASLHLEVDGGASKKSPLSMADQIDIGFTIGGLQVVTDVLAKVSSDIIMDFPVRHLLDWNCWLMVMPPVELNSEGKAINASSARSLAIESFLADMTSLAFNTKCVSCTSPGLQLLPDILDLLESSRAMFTLTRRLEGLVADFVSSDMVVTVLDRLLYEAPRMCPFSPTYDPNVTSDFGSLGVPTLSSTSLDTIMFAGVLAAETAVVVIAENFRQFEHEASDPLSEQKALDDATSSGGSLEGIRFLDWLDLAGSLGLSDLLGDMDLLQVAREYLGGMDENGTLQINELINNFVEMNGTLSMDFNRSLSFDADDLMISVESVQITGLDSFTVFDILNAIGAQTLSNSFALDALAVRMIATVGYKSSSDPPQEISLELMVNDIAAEVSLFAAVDMDKLGSLGIGSLFWKDDVLACILSTASSIKIPHMWMQVGSFLNPTITGLAPDTSAAAGASINAVWERYRQDIQDAIPVIFDTTVREVLNGVLESYITDSACPDRLFDSSFDADELVDFRDLFSAITAGSGGSVYGDVPPLLKGFLDSDILSQDPLTGLSKINEFIRSFTLERSGRTGLLKLAGALFSVSSEKFHRVGVDLFEFSATDISIDNLDTAEHPVMLFEPNATSPVLLDNRVAMGAEPKPLTIGLQTRVAFSGDPVLSTRNQLGVEIDIVDPDMYIILLARISARNLLSFPLSQLTDLHCLVGLLETPELDKMGLRRANELPGISLHTLILTMTQMNFNISCSGSCSTGIAEFPRLFEILRSNGITDLLEERLMDVVLALAQSEYAQTILDRALFHASQQCASHTNYSPDGPSAFDPPQLPVLSSHALETIAFAALYAFEVAIVVVFQSHSVYEMEQRDPLAAQNALKLPADANLVDFSDLTLSVGTWADGALGQLRSYLQERTVDEERGGTDLGINVVLRSFILGDSGKLSIDLTFVDNLELSNFELSLQSLRIWGLDQFNRLDILQGIGPQTMRNKMELKRVRAELDLVVRSGANTMKPTIHLEVADIVAVVSLLAAIDKDLIGNIELGQLLNTSNILRCLLTGLSAFELTEMDISIGKIESFGVTGLEDTPLSSTIETMTYALMEEYKELMTTNFRPFMDYTIRAVLNNWFSYMLSQQVDAVCPKKDLSSTDPGFVDFRDLFLSPSAAIALGGTGTAPYGDLFHEILKIVEQNIVKLDPETGLSDVNGAIVGRMTEAQSNVTGRLFFPGDLFDSGTRIKVGGLDARVSLRMSDVYINNLDTFGTPLSLIDPIHSEPSVLNNTASVGVGKPLQVGVRFFISVAEGSDGGQEIRNDLDVRLDIDDISVILAALLKVSRAPFFQFPLKELPNPHCLMLLVPAPALDPRGVRLEGHNRTAGLAQLVASVARLNMTIKCNECSSPGMVEFAELLSTPRAAEAATATANDIFDFFTDELLGGSYLQVAIDRLLNEAEKQCPSSPSYNSKFVAAAYEPFETPSQEDSIRFLILLGIAMGVILAAVFVITTAVKLIVLRRHRRWMRSLAGSRAVHLWQRQVKEQDRISELNELSQPMFRSPHVPLFLRLAMPVIILGNIGLFLSGHLSLGATVNIEATLGEQSFKVDDFFEFSMLRSTVEIWNAGGKELAILILIFSGIWPYTKQLITLALWFLPPGTVSMGRRGSILEWLDCLAKWSIVDIFTLIVVIAGFRVSIQSPDVGFLPENFYSLDLLVVPLWGLWANFIAQLISQISSHFIIHYHRRVEEKASLAYDQRHNLRSARTMVLDEDSFEITSVMHDSRPSEASQEELRSHAFSRPHRGESEKLAVRRGVSSVLVVGTAALSGLVMAGCAMSSFSLEALGIVGVLVESGQKFEDAYKEHSVFSIVGLLFEQAEFTGRRQDYVGLGSLSVLLVASVLVVPIIQAIVLLYHWFRPIRPRLRHRLSVLVEVLSAWQYAEVYLVSVVVASWQLGPVSEFMINSYCDDLKETFAQLVFYGLMKQEDAQCFRVDSHVESGSYIMAAGAVLLALLNTFIMRAVKQYFRDKENQAHRELDKELMASMIDRVTDETDDRVVRAKKSIRPVPVLFTDTFRWFLVRSDPVGSSHPSYSISSLGITDFGEGGAGTGVDGLEKTVSTEDDSEIRRRPIKGSSHDLLVDTRLDTRFQHDGDHLPLGPVAVVPSKDPSYYDGHIEKGTVVPLPMLEPASSDSSSNESDGDRVSLNREVDENGSAKSDKV